MKYIDAELLRKEIEMLKDEYTDIAIDSQRGWVNANFVIDDLERLQSQIDSLQQEQPEVQNGKFVFPKYLYARTKDNKTIDVSYAPQDMTAVEYIRNDFVEQEQPEVYLNENTMKKEFRMIDSACLLFNYDKLSREQLIARRFYQLGLKARKEE